LSGKPPESGIALTSPTTARGIWAMLDYLRLPDFTFTGYGHYEEEYVNLSPELKQQGRQSNWEG
jgi:hypothetical protein